MSEPLTAADRSRMLDLINRFTGPAPWYWKNFPQIEGFEWTHHGGEGPLAYVVTLGESGRKNDPVLALNTYATPFLLSDGRLGIWFTEGPRTMRILAFDILKLKSFEIEEIVGWFKTSGDRVYSATEPVADFEFNPQMPAGTHSLAVPEELAALQELPIVVNIGHASQEQPACAIFVVYGHAGLVEVLPQTWFTDNKVDTGYQWITRVGRDPITHRLIGDGIRISPFCLTEDGKNLETLLS
ncbi:MAG TPA: hypothetical protein VG897_12195 [Terriglobales bacterium]|nr:hypothetical protein [Terriglobales bacterium]